MKWISKNQAGKYIVRVTIFKKSVYLGTFQTEKEALKVRDKFLRDWSYGLKLTKYRSVKSTDSQVTKASRRIEVQRRVRKARIKKIKPTKGPEYKIQQKIIAYLEDRGWNVRIMTASLYTFGFPDLWAGHPKYGERWIECKNPASHSFTPAQLEFFPIMIACKTPIFILTAANEENYKRLFGKSNLWLYLGGFSNGK